MFGDSVKYKWAENNNIPVIPDVSINCDIRNRRVTNFLGVPKFIMEVLTDATENIDRTKKMELYKKVEVAEYWLVNWRKRQIETYILSPTESTLDEMEYKLVNIITPKNKDELELVTFPNVEITFDELFEL